MCGPPGVKKTRKFWVASFIMRPDPNPSRFFTPLSRFLLTERLVKATIYSAIAWQFRHAQFPSDSKS